MNQPVYTIAPRGNLWRVLQWEYSEGGSKAEVVAVYNEKYKAANRMYWLNRQLKHQK